MKTLIDLLKTLIDLLKTLIDLLDVLIWPVVVSIIIFGFREEIKELLQRLSHIKGGGAEISFREELDEAESEAINVSSEEVNPKPAIKNPEYDRIQRLLNQSPRAAILEAWFLIEEATDHAASSRGLKYPRSLPNRQIMRLLGDEGFLAHEKVYMRLKNIHNQVAHRPERLYPVEYEDAERFVDTAFDLVHNLRDVANQ